MAEEASAAPSVEAPEVSHTVESSDITAPPSSPPKPAAPSEPTEPTEPAQTNGDTSTIPKEDEDAAGKEATTEVNAPDGEGTTEVETAPSAAVDESMVDTTPQSGKKSNKKSNGGVPEHKKTKLSLKRRKSMPVLHLDCKPGEHYWARLKGYPPWPAIICDEQMLPESLLATRPVSTARPDGTIRDDFLEGGKNAKERTYPIMFLSTNEFAWMVNTALTPLEPTECDTPPKSKMTKALSEAWKLASQNHPLDYYKNLLKIYQEEQAQIEKEMREDEERRAQEAEQRKAREEEEAKEAAEEEAKGKKKKPRKSKGGDGDVEMEDADAPKSAKKRKKDAESDGDKPKKTPKVTKLNAPKTPNGESSKKSSKPKKKVVQAPTEDEEDDKPQMSEADKLATREKAVLYLRHRLQKGFLSRDQAPQEQEMAAMADFFSQLEAYENLEPSIIRSTKVHKVLKAIVKLSSIPKDELYNFKKRSAAMLEVWNKRMEAEGDAAPPSATESKPPVSLPIGEGKAAEESNGEKSESAAPAPAASETPTAPAKEEETKEGAADEMVVEKATEAAEELDQKVEAVVAEDEKKDEPAPASEATAEPPVRDAGDVLKDIAMADPAPGEEEPKAEEGVTAAAGEGATAS